MAQRPRQWRITVDDHTIAAGTVAPAVAPGGAPGVAAAGVRAAAPRPHFVRDAWAAPAGRLRDPSLVLCAELLCLVAARLPTRDRLACSAVCRAWRRELCAAAVARNAAVWERLDLGALDLTHATFSRLPDDFEDREARLQNLITTVVLPRYGAVLRELSLRGTAVDDDTLRAVVTACPQLRLLDVRDCGIALKWSCQEDAEDEGSQFLEILTIHYSRAAVGQQFTLLMYGSGFTAGCDICMYQCNQNVVDTLRAVQQWLIQPGPLTAADGKWLRCDVAPCCSYERPDNFFGLTCEGLVSVPLPDELVGERTGTIHACWKCSRYACEVRHAFSAM